jgi:hypothetical protein
MKTPYLPVFAGTLAVGSIVALLASSRVTSAAPPEHAAAPAAGAAAPAAPGAHADEPLVGQPQVAWKDMTKEQKGKFMKAAVMPKMKAAFQTFDPDLFAKFNCQTCHGKDAKARGFKMPSPDLYVLPSTPAEFAPLLEKKGKWMKFMGETVKPVMAGLLGLPNYDPKAPAPGAFGCGGCHTSKPK